MKKYSIWLFVGFFSALLALPALAKDPDQGSADQGRNQPPFVAGPIKFSGPQPAGLCHDLGRGPASHLDLSREQQDKMSALKSRLDKETRDLRYDLAIKHMEMQKLYTDVNARETDLLAKEKELSGLHQKIHEKMVRMMIDSRKILTAEQLAKMDHMPPPPPIMGPGMMGPGAPAGPRHGM